LLPLAIQIPSRNSARQVALTLPGAGVLEQIVDCEVAAGPVGKADRSGSPGYFLHRHQVSQITQTGAAQFFRHGHSEKPQLTELGPKVLWKLVVPVDLLGPGSDFLRGETAHRVAQKLKVFTKRHGYGQAGLLFAGIAEKISA